MIPDPRHEKRYEHLTNAELDKVYKDWLADNAAATDYDYATNAEARGWLMGAIASTSTNLYHTPDARYELVLELLWESFDAMTPSYTPKVGDLVQWVEHGTWSDPEWVAHGMVVVDITRDTYILRKTNGGGKRTIIKSDSVRYRPDQVERTAMDWYNNNWDQATNRYNYSLPSDAQ